MMNYFLAEKEFQRHTLTGYARALAASGFEAKMIRDDDRNWVLNVTVPGLSGFPAGFTLGDITEKSMTLSALFASPLLETPRLDSWTVTPADDPGEICEELISYFVTECSDAEYEKLLVPTMINDENLKFFEPLLSDRVLSGENIYALGAFIRDEGGFEVAAAAGFYVTGDRLVIEDINVFPDYDGLGIADYLVRYIRNMVCDAGIF